ncbi:KpsF/GutQ family sugar-phosphate isomerase [Helicobacter equorum]|uniref:KpsF/GutQ family sugar-phosphate isomerase n=1 Tax=Helicobacter equorum TaxID=361872 RepID=UPI000CF08658|nr:KpsF/GutQ family sugar-phosphate isomerase [Helicobacter equorum]
MSETNQYLQIATEVLHTESQALLDSASRLDSQKLYQIIRTIAESKGKLVVMGVGKSGHIGAKIAATLSSTGTPSFFLHPTEAMHGDLGVIQHDDVILAISYSGESEELLNVLPHIKRFGNTLITMSKNAQSSLSKMSDLFLDIFVQKEACPLNVAPTTSTTLTLALGDVLAVCLMHYRGFTHENFASFHPGGNLGKRLFVKLKDLMQTTNLPIVDSHTTLKECIPLMSEARLGNLLITHKNKLIAILSDGDLRRALLREDFSLEDAVLKYATKNPKTCNTPDMLAFDALKLIEENKIQILVITDKQDSIQGVIHLHTLITAGIKS